MDLWQSLKSRPQILMFLSAEAVTSRVLSDEMSIERTGSLWPYRLPFSFKLSMKSICTNQAAFSLLCLASLTSSRLYVPMLELKM